MSSNDKVSAANLRLAATADENGGAYIEPEAYRGAIVSQRELDALRTVERVVRRGKVA